MDALSALGGALLGGLLVLLGDFVRRRIEWQRENVRRLADAATAFAVLYNRMAGELVDASDRNIKVSDLKPTRPERYATVTRFFLTPGSDRLRGKAMLVVRTYDQLARVFSVKEEWTPAREAHYEAIVGFETAVRSIIEEGRL